MDKLNIIPFWTLLDEKEKKSIASRIIKKTVTKGSFIHPVNEECLGLVCVASGSVRAFITSQSGRELTLYKLKEGDICLFSAKCSLKNISFDILLQSISDCQIYIIPSQVFDKIKSTNIKVSELINDYMTQRFNDVMYLIEQIIFNSFDSRLIGYLKNEVKNQKTDELTITHEQIANDLGSAREVVSRMLKHFEHEDMVKIERGKIKIINI